MIGFVLWMFTSAYAVQIAMYPTPMACAQVAVELSESAKEVPRAFMAKYACVPVLIPAPPPAHVPGKPVI